MITSDRSSFADLFAFFRLTRIVYLKNRTVSNGLCPSRVLFLLSAHLCWIEQSLRVVLVEFSDRLASLQEFCLLCCAEVFGWLVVSTQDGVVFQAEGIRRISHRVEESHRSARVANSLLQTGSVCSNHPCFFLEKIGHFTSKDLPYGSVLWWPVEKKLVGVALSLCKISAK